MTERNPYTLTFGKEPTQIISRVTQSQEVINSFTSETNPQQIYMVTGVRGVGKTVFMTETARNITSNKNWILVELNPERDLLTSLASKLASENELARLFQSAEINLSFFGFGLEVQTAAPVTDIETALQKMLLCLKKKGKRVLIAIDEVTNTQQMKAFAAAFQIFLRQDLPVYLLMTGLYENINSLQNEKSLTFLYRAPKIQLGPLHIGTIAQDYCKVLNISEEEGLALAKMTKGYSFAFQVLGYFAWDYGSSSDKTVALSRQYLDEYAYEKVWAELSRKDKEVLYGIVRSESGRTKDIRDFLGLTSNDFAPYRQRLIRKGVINGEEHGSVHLTLPFFDRFVLEHFDLN